MSVFSNSGLFASASVRCRGGFVFSVYLGLVWFVGSGDHGSRRGYGGELCQASEVLDGSGQVELVAGAAQPSQPEPSEAEVSLQVP